MKNVRGGVKNSMAYGDLQRDTGNPYVKRWPQISAIFKGDNN